MFGSIKVLSIFELCTVSLEPLLEVYLCTTSTFAKINLLTPNINVPMYTTQWKICSTYVNVNLLNEFES